MNLNNKTITYFTLHLLELKYNFFIFCISFFLVFFICSIYPDQIIYFFIKPLLKLIKIKYFIYTGITDIFFLNFYLSILISIYFLIFFFLIQFWFFLKQGLNKKENLKILKNIFIFIILNIIFFYIVFIKIIPYLWIYFYNINFKNDYIFNIYLEPKLYDYFSFIFTLYIYIYIICIYPFILYFLV